MAFPADHPILFKAYAADENVVARYALIGLGFGTVDDVTIEKALKAGAVNFDYYYDTQSKKRVILTLEGEQSGTAITVPTLLPDAKGPEPAAFDNGYVAFEDLPKERRRLPDEEDDDDFLDDDDEVDEEDEDDDKPEEIYDNE